MGLGTAWRWTRSRYAAGGLRFSRRRGPALLFAGFFFALAAASAVRAADPGDLNYGRDVRPILSENCFPCHGQDGKKRMAGLRLDSFEGATADRGGHAALVPGSLAASAIYQRITAAQPARRMPPPYSNHTLTAEQIAILKRWIEAGGVYTRHWAFVPPRRPTLPETRDRAWAKQPVDAFVLQRLEAEGLRPSPAATPQAWLRRVSLDLTGLPPSAAELDSFAKDAQARGDAAYGAAVDRLLASPRYGERMAMDWLDVARYADTHGFNNDSERSMWRWRDWVIQSFNANLPYDRFLTEQLAGDLLPGATLDQRIATAFCRNHVINSEGGIIEEEYRVEYVADRVRTLGMAWLGLTLECAHCHDHKFDPITQRDHYRFFAFFNNVAEFGEDGRVANAVPMIAAPDAEQQERLRALEAQIAELWHRVADREKSWTWSEAGAAAVLRVAAGSVAPEGPALHFACESAAEFDQAPEKGFTLVPGIAGRACQATDAEPKTPGKGVLVSKLAPLSFTGWIRPAATDSDAALLSSMDYATNPAATTYGKGLEVRFVAGEIEFRLADRFPAYSVRLRSEGAHLAADEWHHLAVTYEGAAGKNSMRVQAAWVRVFVDGREMAVRILNDDLAQPDEKNDKPSPTRFRIGWDNSPSGARYAGAFDEFALWTRALDASQIGALFYRQALPYAVESARQGKASHAEATWLRTASLKAGDAGFAAVVERLDRLRSEWLALRRSLPTVMVMQEMAAPRETHVLLRGAYSAPGEKVEAGVPEELLGAWPADAPRNRLGLAQWLTRPDHPLTSRVVVNRFWQHLFGQGLVKTSENFGLQGDWPSHPELLDWMAREFIDSG